MHYRVVPPVDDPDLPASEIFVAARIEGRVVSSQANPKANAERGRLAEARVQGVPWRRWGPYRSERQWGTVREDYSQSGDAWDYFSHDQARSRAYRWGEDGLAGVSDDRQWLCFALALWNGKASSLTLGSRAFETLFQTIVTRPSLKGLLSPNGSRRQRLARHAIDQVRCWLR